MSYPCHMGRGECDGCGACRTVEDIGVCEACGQPIQDGEGYYDFDGSLVHEECLLYWAEKYRVK